MLSSAARREERLAPPWEELKSVGCSNGRLLTTPTLPGRHHLPAVRKQLPSWRPSEDRRQAGIRSGFQVRAKVPVPKHEGSRLLLEFTVHGLVGGWWLND